MSVGVGDPAPDFTLPGTGEHEYSLSDYRGVLDAVGKVTRKRQARDALILVAELVVSGLVVAGLLLTSFLRVMSVDRGFDVDQILAVDVRLPRPRYLDGSGTGSGRNAAMPAPAATCSRSRTTRTRAPAARSPPSSPRSLCPTT